MNFDNKRIIQTNSNITNSVIIETAPRYTIYQFHTFLSLSGFRWSQHWWLQRRQNIFIHIGKTRNTPMKCL